MIEQTVEEVAESMADHPKHWAENYIYLLQQLADMHDTNEKLLLQLLPTNQKH